MFRIHVLDTQACRWLNDGFDLEFAEFGAESQGVFTTLSLESGTVVLHRTAL